MIDVKTVGNDQIVGETTIEASPETIFAALTQPEQLKTWWGDDQVYRADKWSIDLRIGGKYRSEGKGVNGDAFVVEGEYVEIDPPRVLSYIWRPSWADKKQTTVRFVLTPKGNGTHLHMTHSGFAEETARQNHAQGWPLVLGWLKNFTERQQLVRVH